MLWGHVFGVFFGEFLGAFSCLFGVDSTGSEGDFPSEQDRVMGGTVDLWWILQEVCLCPCVGSRVLGVACFFACLELRPPTACRYWPLWRGTCFRESAQPLTHTSGKAQHEWKSEFQRPVYPNPSILAYR